MVQRRERLGPQKMVCCLLVCYGCYCLFDMWATEACWHAVGKWKIQKKGVTDIVRSWRRLLVPEKKVSQMLGMGSDRGNMVMGLPFDGFCLLYEKRGKVNTVAENKE